jgi:hypothetical protein
MRYERCRPDEIPINAVIVSVWRALGRTVADIACSTLPTLRECNTAEFPRPVPHTLERAEELRERYDLTKIVIVIEDESLWRESWGELLPFRGLH